MRTVEGDPIIAATQVSARTLKRLEPIGAMSESRLEELATLCYVEQVSKTLDPFRIRPLSGSTVYLLRGEIALTLKDGSPLLVVGGSDEARHPLGRRAAFTAARAITDIELVRFDDELIDIMMTWDQLSEVEVSRARKSGRPEESGDGGDWRLLTGVFSVNNLRFGALSRLPTAHVGELLGRFERVEAERGQSIVREGDEGDYYYVLENGRAQVTRKVGGVDMRIAQLKAGDAFGEEALLADSKRNATVTMLTSGALLRLSKAHFNDLLRKPLLREIDREQALAKVAAGAQWIDVRYPSEYQYDRWPGALNIPLGEVRNALRVLDQAREYVVYCQSGRRSSAAAFLLAQRGFSTYVLSGGLALAGERA
jgi:rhodanese-related sulfurtransferase